MSVNDGTGRLRRHAMLLWLPVALFVALTMYPYRLSPPVVFLNGGEVLDGALRFESPGTARTRRADAGAVADQVVGLRLTVRPHDVNERARITTIAGETAVLAVEQQSADLTVVFWEERAGGASAVVTASGVLQRAARNDVQIDVVFDRDPDTGAERFVVSVAGENVGQAHLPSPRSGLTDGAVEIVFGNDREGRQPWLGVLRAARLDTPGASTNLLADEFLTIPLLIAYDVRALVLATGWVDMTANLLIFVPFGFAAASAFSTRAAFRAVRMWVAIILMTEFCQLFVEYRYATLSDIVMNSAGVTVGALLGSRYGRRWFARRGDGSA